MEAANERALRSRGRLAYSLRVIARRREELGENSVPTRRREERPTLPVQRMKPLGEDWLRACKMNGNSPRTIAERQWILGWFFWFIEREQSLVIGRTEIEAYLLHVRTGHEEEHGRFGIGATNPKAFQPVRPATYRHHYSTIKAFFSFQTKRGLWTTSPLMGVECGKKDDEEDVVQPLSDAEIELLLAMAKRGQSPARDGAIIRILADTGVRVSELCGIIFDDVDEKTSAIKIRGKGGKKRIVYIGDKTARALWKHITDVGVVWGEDARKSSAPLFAAERGSRAGQNLQPRGLGILLQRLGQRAGVSHVHPHRFRHTFAVNFLRNGGNQISLMRLLGHTDLTMTKHYVNFVEADLEEQHRKFSPGDRLRG